MFLFVPVTLKTNILLNQPIFSHREINKKKIDFNSYSNIINTYSNNNFFEIFWD